MVLTNLLVNAGAKALANAGANLGRKISKGEIKLPHIGEGTQRKMPTYTDGALAFQWLGVAPRAEGFAQLGGSSAAPWLLAPNAIDTVVNGLPNVYNWAADEYNAWASKRALDYYQSQHGRNFGRPTYGQRLETITDPATANEVVARNNAILNNGVNRMEEAKSKIVKALGDLAAGKQIATAAGKARAKALIDLYNKIK